MLGSPCVQRAVVLSSGRRPVAGSAVRSHQRVIGGSAGLQAVSSQPVESAAGLQGRGAEAVDGQCLVGLAGGRAGRHQGCPYPNRTCRSTAPACAASCRTSATAPPAAHATSAALTASSVGAPPAASVAARSSKERSNQPREAHAACASASARPGVAPAPAAAAAASACSDRASAASAASAGGSWQRSAPSRAAKVAAEGGTPAWHMWSKADWAAAGVPAAQARSMAVSNSCTGTGGEEGREAVGAG